MEAKAMKSILIILFALPVVCCGQKKDSLTTITTGVLTLYTNDGYVIPSWEKSTTPKQDTIKVLLFVCDTSEKYSIWPSFEIDTAATRIFSDTSKTSWKDYVLVGSTKNDTTNRRYNNSVWWQFGHEVYEPYTTQLTLSPFDKVPNSIYLDANKKPLPKSIVVWMSKEIKQ
jgi:hypothetical protein